MPPLGKDDTQEEATILRVKRNIKKIVATREGEVIGMIAQTDIVRKSPQLARIMSGKR